MSDDADEFSQRERVALRQLARQQINQWPTRRQTVAGMVGVGAMAFGAGRVSGDASTSDSDGNVGTPSNRVDVFADGVDSTSLTTTEADVTNETYIEAHLVTDATGVSAGTFTNIVDTEDTDVTGEFNSSSQFVPSETGRFEIEAWARLTGGTDGDDYGIRLRNVTDNNSVLFWDPGNLGATAVLPLTATMELTSGKAYEVQARNNSNSYTITGAEANTALRIKKSLVHP